MRELLIQLLLIVPITYGDFEYCEKGTSARHHITIQDDVILKNYIEVCNNTKDKSFHLLHELGHQFWHTHLSLTEREQYRKMFSSKNSDFWRNYGMVSPEEDFADNFANIYLKREYERSEKYNQKINFIKKIIKRY
jgi:hypothetical protein